MAPRDPTGTAGLGAAGSPEPRHGTLRSPGAIGLARPGPARARRPLGQRGEPGHGESGRRPRGPAVSDPRRGKVRDGSKSTRCGNARIGGAKDSTVRWDRPCPPCRGQPAAAACGTARGGTARARRAAEVQAAAVPGAGRRLVAPGPGSVGAAEHPGSDGPPQGASIRTRHLLPPAAGSRTSSGLPRTGSRRALGHVTRPTWALRRRRGGLPFPLRPGQAARRAPVPLPGPAMEG